MCCVTAMTYCKMYVFLLCPSLTHDTLLSIINLLGILSQVCSQSHELKTQIYSQQKSSCLILTSL